MSAPTSKQMAFLQELVDLVGVSRLQVGDVETAEEASKAIDRLLDMRDGGAPIRQATRAAVFAALRDLGISKEVAYAGAGVTTLAEGAVERDARRVLAWLEQQRVEVRRPNPRPMAGGVAIIPGRGPVRPPPQPRPMSDFVALAERAIRSGAGEDAARRALAGLAQPALEAALLQLVVRREREMAAAISEGRAA